jgi:hypothetical protein
VTLAGRADLLDELDSLLSGGTRPWPRMVTLCGLGGVGKTSVAVEYAHRHLPEVRVAWQLSAEDPAVLAAGFAELAAQLGAWDPVDFRDPVASAHAVLAADPAQWLLVFDNAPDQESLLPFLPPAGHGQVLITSRDPVWPSGTVIEVNVLSAEIAAEFLTSRTGDPDRLAASQLAGELGGLPLALEQAAAYLQVTGETVPAYLTAFRRQRMSLLSRSEPAGYRQTVATTWILALGQLRHSHPRAVGLLNLLACCAPEAIPVRLLLQPAPRQAAGFGADVSPVLGPLAGDPLELNDAIAALRRYSLVSLAGDGLVTVHRLVQAVVADQMSPEQLSQWKHAASVLIEAAIPDETGRPDTWSTCAALIGHAQAGLGSESAGIERIAEYLGHSGSYSAAGDLWRQILDSRIRTLGPGHVSTLTAQVGLAYWTGMAGDAASARDQYVALVTASERLLGPAHPDTLTARASLARWTGMAGDPAGARDQFAALLPLREQVSGTDHHSTLAVRGNLARWTGMAGDPALARDQLAALLPVRQQVSGPDHPAVLTTRHSLAYSTGMAGDPASARDQLAALWPISERVLGPEHPDTLATRQELAYFTARAGDPAEARSQYAALLPVLERIDGPQHRRTITVRAELEAGGPAGAP